MKAREFIYSILLLMVLTLGGVGALFNNLFHCVDHDNHAAHHSCHQELVDCSSHRYVIEHKCAAKSNDMPFEYIAAVPQRVITSNVNFVVAIFELAFSSIDLLPTTLSRCFEWCEYDLYCGYDPSCRSLRAPPALV